MDLIFLLIILIFIYFIYYENIENYDNDLDINIDISDNIKITNLNNVREITSYSKYNQDKIDFQDIKFKDDTTIQEVYDFLVDDLRKYNNKFETIDTYDTVDYYDINNEDEYGYTNFTTYKKNLKNNNSLSKEQLEC